jgi:hypothetical protein
MAVDPELREQVIRRDGGCVMKDMVGLRCWGRLDPHHVSPKGMGGTKRPDTADDLITLCRIHHDYVHHNIPCSREHGYLRRRDHRSP